MQAEAGERSERDQDPQPASELQTVEGRWSVMVEDRQQDTVENAVDAGVGAGEGVVAEGGQQEAPCDHASSSRGEGEFERAHRYAPARGEGKRSSQHRL